MKCIDDEIPFEIPQGWEWVRLGNIIDFSKSETIKNQCIHQNAWVLDLEDIEKDSGRILHKKRMKDLQAKSDKHPFRKGNVLYSKLRPYLNKVIIADEDGVCTSEILCFDFGLISARFAQLYLMSPYFVSYAMSDAYGVKMPRLGSKQGNNALMPIPPLPEQHHIIAKVDELLPFIEHFSRSQFQLDQINTDIRTRLKKSILQEAIQGRLVPQIAEEGTAEDLLAKIRTEKQKLLKEGKLKKKDITDSTIFKGDDNKYYEKIGKEVFDITEEIPFDIPDSWCWCRLGTIFQHNTGKALNRADQKGSLLTYITTSNLYWDRFELDNLRQMYFTDEEISKCTVQKGDLLVCEGGDIGRAAIWPFEEPVRIQNHIHRLRPYSTINTRFFYYTMAHFKDSGVIGGKGIGIQGLSSGALHQLLLPIPPLDEQYRVVEKMDKTLASIMRG